MIENKEIWKDIPGFEGYYQASNLGRIKSLARSWVGGYGAIRSKPETELKSSPNSSGYLQVVLSKNGKPKTIKVHQLVAMAFLGHQRCGYEIIVDHKNNNHLDNRVENLQLITVRENVSKDNFRRKLSSRYIGVYWYKAYKKWKSCIRVNGKYKHLGYFDNEYDAHLAYQGKLKEIK